MAKEMWTPEMLAAHQAIGESAMPLVFVTNVKRLRAPVASVEEAARKWEELRNGCIAQGNGGVSEIGNGGTVLKGRKVVARISYNGRIWL